MNATSMKSSVMLFAAVIALGGCATNPHVESAPGTLWVSYSNDFPGGAPLKEVPHEVGIVEREHTQKEVARQVVLNVMTMALLGGAGVSGFSKHDLQGRSINDVADRRNIKNPIPTEFVARMQGRVDAWLADNPEFGDKGYRNPLTIGSGNVRLIYESLIGDDGDRFRLITELKVYKRQENVRWMPKPPVTIDCSAASVDALPRQDWAADEYVAVKAELDVVLEECERTVMAHLPRLLRQ